MKPSVKIGLAILSAWNLSNCSGGTGHASSDHTVGGRLLLDISAQEMKEGLLKANWPIGKRKVYGYKAYEIPYQTKDEHNTSVKASGLLVVPTGLSNTLKKEGLSLVSYGHGTITLDEDAPTVSTKNEELPVDSAIIFSSLGGFATLEADYIGYGDSRDHYHPYVMKKSSANCSVDFIAAVKTFAKANKIKLNTKLFVTGYSEGGYAAMSTLKALEEENISVTAAAPMAGPYDLQYMADTALGLNDKNMSHSVTYSALTLYAYSKSYDKNLSKIIKKPYASKIHSLLNGRHSFDEINRNLPKTVDGLLRPDFMDDYLGNDNNWFKLALKENSVNDWKPHAPLRLVHCKGDDQVPYAISQNTHRQMRENGANDIKLIAPDAEQGGGKKWNHLECYYPAIKSVALWFVEMRDKHSK